MVTGSSMIVHQFSNIGILRNSGHIVLPPVDIFINIREYVGDKNWNKYKVKYRYQPKYIFLYRRKMFFIDMSEKM